MIEAFERHLRTHNISKQFEEAKTKEQKIEVCKKFLEDEGLTVRSKLDAEKQMQEGERYSMVANPLVLKGQGGGGGSQSGTLTLDANTINNLVIGGPGAGKILPNSFVWNDGVTTVSKEPKYFQVHYRLSESLESSFEDAKNAKLYAVSQLMDELSEGLKKFVIQNNLIKEETDYSTLDKHYTIKVGFVE